MKRTRGLFQKIIDLDLLVGQSESRIFFEKEIDNKLKNKYSMCWWPSLWLSNSHNPTCWSWRSKDAKGGYHINIDWHRSTCVGQLFVKKCPAYPAHSWERLNKYNKMRQLNLRCAAPLIWQTSAQTHQTMLRKLAKLPCFHRRRAQGQFLDPRAQPRRVLGAWHRRTKPGKPQAMPSMPSMPSNKALQHQWLAMRFRRVW